MGEDDLAYDPTKKSGTDSFVETCYEDCYVFDEDVDEEESRTLESYIRKQWEESGGEGTYDPCLNSDNICYSGHTDPEGLDCDGFAGIFDDCGDADIDVGRSCQYNYEKNSMTFVESNHICAADEYCAGNGIFFNDGDNRNCCYGVTAGCEVMTKEICDETPNYNWRNDEEISDISCNGPEYDLEGGVCCYGDWTSSSINVYEWTVPASSFICYQRDNFNNFQECCNGFNCENAANTPNPLNEIDRVYSLTGTSYHVLVYADDDANRNVIKMKKANNEFDSLNDFSITDWSNFDFLEIIIKTTDTGNPETITIVSKNEDETDELSANLLLWEYRTTSRSDLKANRILIPIEDIKNAGILTSKIVSFEFNFKDTNNEFESVAKLLNIGLVKEEEASTISTNWFCAGDYRMWLENLDGPEGDEGFVEGVDTEKQGAYKNACEHNPVYGWTGTACCGDDTRIYNGYSEYFVSYEGLCWGGVFVEDGERLRDSSGLIDPVSITILYYQDKVQLCNTEISEYNDVHESYGEGSDEGIFLTEANAINNAPFTVKAGWTCTISEGWKKTDQINRFKILAAEMRGLAEDDDYTLFCGDYDNITNFVSGILDQLGETNAVLADKGCYLRKGSNDDFENTLSVVGLALTNENDPIDYFITNFIKKLDEFQDYSEEDKIGIDCSDAPDDLDAKLFTECTITGKTENDFYKIYYDKPYNLLLISSDTLTGSNIDNAGVGGWFVDLWNGFTTMIAKLFGANTEWQLPSSVTTKVDLSHFYISVQKNTKIVGTLYDGGDKKTARVDYDAFHNSVKIFADAFDAIYGEDMLVKYSPNEYSQTIYIEAEDPNDLNWKKVTSLLRTNDVSDATNFGTPECGNGNLELGETCDDNNEVNGDGCSSDCELEVVETTTTTFCGDDYIQSPNDDGEIEVCDAGDQNGIACTAGTQPCTYCNDYCQETIVPATGVPTCSDKIQNGDETGVDCGGPDCPACIPDGTATCDDDIQNQGEAGVDCGGPCPSGTLGHSCNKPAMCTGKNEECSGSICTCIGSY